MTPEKLKIGIELSQKLKEIDEAMNCFEWPADPEFGLLEPLNRHPQLVIESDNEDEMRVQYKLPMVLSNEIISFIKRELSEEKTRITQQFLQL